MSVYHHDRESRGNCLSKSPRRTPGRQRRTTRHRPRLELLESRLVLSPTIFTVDSTGNGTSGSGMSGTLPYVISQANANTSTDGSEIEFEASVFSSPQTITLGAALVLSETTGPEVIDGRGAGLVTISGGGTVGVFATDSGVTASISGLTISGGSTTGNGGGLENYGTATLTGCTISGNSATDSGGGLWNGGSGTATMTLAECTISGNSASEGGGLYNISSATATMTLADCTISGNSAGGNGGGGENDGTARMTFTDCTLSDNSAGCGGGLWNGGGTATLTLTACTISGNSASGNSAFSGGLYNTASPTATFNTATLIDSIVAGNTGSLGGPSDIGGSQASQVIGSYNLIGTGGSGGITGGIDGNIVPTSLADLSLSPLGNYGGRTETMALLPGSPAIGKGESTSGVTTDQRGFPLDTSPDIGAFQTQTGLVVNTAIDGTGSPSGDLSLRQAVNLANALDGAETITFDPTVFASAETITLAGSQLELSDTGGTETITGPTAGVTVSGGGMSRVFQVDASVTASISGLTITGGSTTGSGGGLSSDGVTTLTNCTVSGNSASEGGGLANNGTTTLTLNDVTVSKNTTSGYGGGIIGGTTTLTNCTVSGNSAGDSGGGINSNGVTTLTNCTVSDNTADKGAGGIGLYFTTATLTNCTVS
ncbi:MAG: choice-of-anchor Q domain-containing protein, partial [Isosphaeraceae bacterium]